MMNVSRISVLLFALILALVVRCRASGKKYDLPVRTSNRFAIKLHQLLASDGAYKDGNIIFSPMSLSMALGMVRLGTRGNTSNQIDGVFHWNNTKSILNVHTGFRHLRKMLTSSKLSKNKAYKLSIANRIWAADGFRILAELKNNTRQYYGAGVATSDFTNPRAREKINNWVDGRTNGKIKNLIPLGFLDPLTRMVVVNAMYFKGAWQKTFNPAFTADFDSSSGRKKQDSRKKEPVMKVQMMTMPRAELNYFEDTEAKCQILELPYKGNDASMVVVLPRKRAGSNIHLLEESLSYGKLRRWMKNLTKKNVTVYLPKFKLSLDLRVKSFLEKMGIVDLFTPNLADLSGITENNSGLFVKHLLHKAFVQVDEQGTEAAAATEVIISVRSYNPRRILFHADRPFLFYIHHKITNTILLMGRVKKPTLDGL